MPNIVVTYIEKIIIAGCFQNIGIWPEGPLDYLPPSIERAEEYLVQNDLADWCPEIELMIGQHHKVRKCQDTLHPLVGEFRRTDLVDFSLGLVKSGVPAAYVKAVKAAFPNARFHKQLVRNTVTGSAITR